MSHCFLACSILIKMIIVVKSAPKLGHILFDPLDYEANLTMEVTNEAENTTDILYLRSNITIQESTTQKANNSNGYGFDATICKEKDDRILCGYDKNIDNVDYEEVSEESGNGCRIRGDRLECGYLVGPFTNPRRPPANYIELVETNDTERPQTVTTQTTIHTSETTITKTKTIQSRISKLSKIQPTNKLNISTTVTSNTTSIRPELINKLITQNSKNKTLETKSKCVDKNDHLFCIPTNIKEKS